MAYVGCIAGAIPIAEYVEGLKAAGFTAVEVIDAKKDLNAYAQVEGQAGCCPPAMDGAPASACCAPDELLTIHRGLADLLRKYDVNEYAASVQVYAVKGA
jgi:arsenite methyltransferase